MISTIVISVLIAITSALVYIKWRHTYWTRRGVIQLDTQLFLGKKSFAENMLEQYRKARELKQKYVGRYFFNIPAFVPVDLTIIKNMMQKDFAHFRSHGTFHDPKDVLSMNLFNLDGDNWRNLRVKLTPTFTSGKMKMMFDTLIEKTLGLENVIGDFADTNQSCAIKDVLGRFTTDIIGSCAFGIECNSLEEKDNAFRIYGKKVFVMNVWKFWLLFILPPKLLASLGFKMSGQDVTKFFSNIVKETIKHRELSQVTRKDFMHLLLELKNNPDQSITDNEIIAQCFVFFLAGFETSSTAMTFALLELAQNQDIQEKLRQDINEVLDRHNGKLSYEAVMEMKYLDMTVNETLRKFPPVAVIPRICTKDYLIPGTDVVIQKGTRVQIPVWGIHKDPEYYPDPEVFNPENFSEENKAKRPDFTFLPFGEGPRMCIGLRFGMMQTKVGLISLLRKFNFTLNKKTPFPLEMEKSSVVLSVKGDVWLDVTRI